MQIDFHLGATYVLARMAGFSQAEADIIAGAAQFVDDAIHEGVLYFDNEFLFEFESSAHRNLDYRNFHELTIHRVWIPFHFLPCGESSLPSSQAEAIREKLVCRPDSRIAQDLLLECKKNFQSNQDLYLLGVTIHAYADTWAHQGFSGISDQLNVVEEIYDEQGLLDETKMRYRQKYYDHGWPHWVYLLKKFYQRFLSFGISVVNPIGHGAVLSFPDQPFLIWKYKDWKGQVIHRDNPKDYIEASEKILQYFHDLRKSCGLSCPDIQQNDWQIFQTLIRNTQQDEGFDRLTAWHSAIEQGKFSFGNQPWLYSQNGSASWTKELFGVEDESEFSHFNLPYRDEFLTSHWKRAYDALKQHRFIVLHKILPKHQLCVL